VGCAMPMSIAQMAFTASTALLSERSIHGHYRTLMRCGGSIDIPSITVAKTLVSNGVWRPRDDATQERTRREPGRRGLGNQCPGQ
jgi:hypothetical protein